MIEGEPGTTYTGPIGDYQVNAEKGRPGEVGDPGESGEPGTMGIY